MIRADITQLSCTIILILSVVSGTYQSVLAMHDSQLDVNTWIASDNVTQLNTIDLNRGPISPGTATAGATSADGGEDPNSVDSTTGAVPPASDEEEQDTDTVTDTEEDGDEEDEEDDGAEGNSDEEEEG